MHRILLPTFLLLALWSYHQAAADCGVKLNKNTDSCPAIKKKLPNFLNQDNDDIVPQIEDLSSGASSGLHQFSFLVFVVLLQWLRDFIYL